MVAAIVFNGTVLPPTFIFQGKSVSHEIDKATYDWIQTVDLPTAPVAGLYGASTMRSLNISLHDMLTVPETWAQQA